MSEPTHGQKQKAWSRKLYRDGCYSESIHAKLPDDEEDPDYAEMMADAEEIAELARLREAVSRLEVERNEAWADLETWKALAKAGVTNGGDLAFLAREAACYLAEEHGKHRHHPNWHGEKGTCRKCDFLAAHPELLEKP